MDHDNRLVTRVPVHFKLGIIRLLKLNLRMVKAARKKLRAN